VSYWVLLAFILVCEPWSAAMAFAQVPGRDSGIAAATAGLSPTTNSKEANTRIKPPSKPEEFANVKILNNMVWELLKVERILKDAATESFTLPYDRWVFFQTRADVKPGGEVWIAIDSDTPDKAVVTHKAAGESAREAMRFLRAGKHGVHVGVRGSGELKYLVVRAIPMLQHAFYGANPHIAPYGPYDWDFLRKNILPNVNTMISIASADPPELKEWKAGGRNWISIARVPSFPKNEPLTVSTALKHWSETTGMQNPLMDGIIIDEFGGGNDPVYDVYRKAVERIYEDPKLRNKMVMPYVYGSKFYGSEPSAELARVCIAHGGYICWERYMSEQPTEKEAQANIDRLLVKDMPAWERRFSGAARHICIVLGLMSQPTESLNTNPAVNYKVYLDMQFRTLATRPELFGLGGVQVYHTSYSDEENVRWASRLYRHYCIEGHTEPLTQDPYKLTHLRNPDFAEGTSSWTISPAEPNSMEVKQYPGYSWLEGRYPRTKEGDSFLWMKRSTKKPNMFSQGIRDLTPGRLYSMKMITADYQNLLEERSGKSEDAISIKIEGAEMLTGPKKSFQFTFPNSSAHHLGKFIDKYHYWMNYHWQVFRANTETVRLIVSDWKNEKDAGGPPGQETALNFIEIQPYIGE